MGLTRERVRQIVDPLMRVKIELDGDIPLLVKAVELFEDCEDEDQFSAKVADDAMFSGESISWQRLWGLTRILSPDNLADRVYQKHLDWEAESGANSPIRNLIKKDRSKFGLYDLQVISKSMKLVRTRLLKSFLRFIHDPSAVEIWFLLELKI